ncbi:hypothetical protein OEA41_007851 [Lepraria neglecta]|uniref:Amidase domain-containing protein n=1 Tax=Lepraria neglecta TaxID=209136 RepID=A0AAD9ZEN8_9LECA|nr:hypothetical protein OEA41_007851 [Lepraria neglecta]
MKDLDLNAGFVAWVGTKVEGDALILKILWQAGCVFNFRGSIRSPAANNGLFGLRPTSCRIPRMSYFAPQLGSGYIDGVLGLLSISLNGIKIFMKTIIAAKPWVMDPSLVPLPWRDEQSYLEENDCKRLKVAILWSDAVVKPHPPIMRILKKVVRKLRKVGGVEVVEWKPYKHDFAWELTVNLPISLFSKQIYQKALLTNKKHRNIAEIQTIRLRIDKYRYEYAQRKSPKVRTCCVFTLTIRSVEFNRHWRG